MLCTELISKHDFAWLKSSARSLDINVFAVLHPESSATIFFKVIKEIAR